MFVLLLLLAAAAKAAAEWCKGPEIKKRTCGWASKEEIGMTVKTCATCGTFYGSPVARKIPFVHDRCTGCGGSEIMAPEYVSLACRPGKLVVRAVWKLLEMPQNGRRPGSVIRYDGDTDHAASNVEKNIRRCQLDLAPHRPGGAVVSQSEVTQSEVDVALTSKEINCEYIVNGHERSPGKMPEKEWYSVGKWYSDSFHFSFGGCAAVSKPGATYRPALSDFILNPREVGPKLLLAKFDVQEAN
jgi:hypothetical protein